MNLTVFVPVTTAQLRQLSDPAAATTALPVNAAFAATEALKAEFGYGPDEDEDADYAAQLVAGLQSLLDRAPRLVLAVSVDADAVAPAEPANHGAVDLTQITWQQVQAIFVDEADAAQPAAALAQRLAGTGLVEAWAQKDVRQFVTDHELLWFATQECADALAMVQD